MYNFRAFRGFSSNVGVPSHPSFLKMALFWLCEKAQSLPVLHLGLSSPVTKLWSLFLSHFWTKIWCDNCFETVWPPEWCTRGYITSGCLKKLALVILLLLDHDIILSVTVAVCILDNDLVEFGLQTVFKSWQVFQKLWGRPMPKTTRTGSGASCSLK